MKEQFLGVDIIRFLAAMMVFVYHFGFWHTVAADGTFSLWSPGAVYPLRDWTDFGWVGVEIFFVISGFVIAFSAKDATPGGFFTARALRLAPAVWFCAPLTFLIYLDILDKSVSQEFVNLLRTLFFIPVLSGIDPVYWTLAIEISFYYLIWAMLAKNIGNGAEKLPQWLLAVSFTFWAGYFIACQTLDRRTYGDLLHALMTQRALELLLVRHGSFFGLGVLLSILRNRPLSRWESFCLVGSVATCWLEIVGNNRNIADVSKIALSPWPALAVWTAAMLALVLCVVCNRSLWRTLAPIAHPIRTLGLMSYPIYLLHNPIGLAVFYFGLGGRAFFANLAVAAALILVASWAVAAHVEPFLRRRLKSAFVFLQTRSISPGLASPPRSV